MTFEGDVECGTPDDPAIAKRTRDQRRGSAEDPARSIWPRLGRTGTIRAPPGDLDRCVGQFSMPSCTIWANTEHPKRSGILPYGDSDWSSSLDEADEHDADSQQQEEVDKGP
jgi:hypothetical protein